MRRTFSEVAHFGFMRVTAGIAWSVIIESIGCPLIMIRARANLNQRRALGGSRSSQHLPSRHRGQRIVVYNRISLGLTGDLQESCEGRWLFEAPDDGTAYLY
jgi:hypothetical protein